MPKNLSKIPKKSRRNPKKSQGILKKTPKNPERSQRILINAKESFKNPSKIPKIFDKILKIVKKPKES